MKMLLLAFVYALYSCAYWVLGGAFVDHISYNWGADPTFGLTDDQSPWPMVIFVIVYAASCFVFTFIVAKTSKTKKGH